MKKRPNIVYILTDDMGYGDVSCLNPASAFRTPNFDALAADGMAFTDAHAVSAVCTQSRYGILTGRYSWRSALKTGVLVGYSRPLIEEGRQTVANLLKSQGYRTYAVGKWHLGMSMPYVGEAPERITYADIPNIDYHGRIEHSPTAYGFDYSYCIAASLDMPPYVYIENDRFTEIPDHVTENTGKQFWRPGPTAPGFRHEDALPTFTKKALSIIDRASADEPFFLYLPLPAPHTPILPTKEFQGRSGTNEYGDFVLMCDDVVGQVRNKLIEKGLYENTILVLTADNGCSPMADFEELRACGHNPSYIFRGHKADIYEGGHRIPCLISWPDAIPAGTTCDRLVSLSDLYATLADYFGVALADDCAEDSVSNLPLWRNPSADAVREDAVQQSIDGSLTIRSGKWKLAMCPGSGGWSYPKPGVDDTSMLPAFQLFDMEKDVRETHNVIEAYPDVARELRDRLTKYVLDGRSTPGTPQANTGAPVWKTVKWLEEQAL